MFVSDIVKNIKRLDKIKDINTYKIIDGKKEEIDLDSFVSRKSSGSSTEENMDWGVLEFGINAYDMSTSTKIKKKLGMDFAWTDSPGTLGTDAMALSHTGLNVGITDCYDDGAYMKYYYGNEWRDGNKYIDSDPEGNGLSAEIDLRTGRCYGRAYVVIGNTKKNVDEDNYFFMVAKFAHAIKGYRLNPCIGVGSVSFSPSTSTKIVESDTLKINSIKTY